MKTCLQKDHRYGFAVPVVYFEDKFIWIGRSAYAAFAFFLIVTNYKKKVCENKTEFVPEKGQRHLNVWGARGYFE